MKQIPLNRQQYIENLVELYRTANLRDAELGPDGVDWLPAQAEQYHCNMLSKMLREVCGNEAVERFFEDGDFDTTLLLQNQFRTEFYCDGWQIKDIYVVDNAKAYGRAMRSFSRLVSEAAAEEPDQYMESVRLVKQEDGKVAVLAELDC